MGFEAIVNHKLLGLSLTVILLSACGGGAGYTGPYHVTEYIAENNSSHTLDITYIDGCLYEEVTVPPGQRIAPFRQKTAPGTFNERPAFNAVHPSSAEFKGFAAFKESEQGLRRLVGLWERPFDSLFTYEGQEVIDENTYHSYAMSFDDTDLDFSLRLPFNYYWLLNNSSKELSVTTTTHQTVDEFPDFLVTDLHVAPGEKVILAKLNHSPSSTLCPSFRSNEPFYTFDTITVSKEGLDGYTPVPWISNFGIFFTEEGIVDPESDVLDFHHTMTITEAMVNN